jgi:DNA-binding protein H-NS
MARPKRLDKMSFAELTELERRIVRAMAHKQNAARVALRERISSIAKEHGFDAGELFGEAGKRKGSVPVKYRDPKNAQHTWTGRGRMPSWMVAATKNGKRRKENFLIK